MVFSHHHYCYPPPPTLAPHSSHLPERFGLFILIVLGETIGAVVNGIAGHQWTISSAIAAASGISIAFSLWWIYFENLGGSAIQAARKYCRLRAYQIWLYTHLPLAIGIATTGAGVRWTYDGVGDVLHVAPLPVGGKDLQCCYWLAPEHREGIDVCESSEQYNTR